MSKEKSTYYYLFISDLIHLYAKGIGMKKNFMKAGVERAVYQRAEVSINSNPIGWLLLAKMSINEERDQLEFHKQCALSQLKARRLARKFNTMLLDCGINLPSIKFFEPIFYVLKSR